MVTNLRILRVKRGLTIRKLAKELEIHECWLNRMELGQSYIPPHLRQKIADFFGVQVSEICDEATGWPILVDMEMPKLVRKA
ncbi:MAG: helix-turn-helix protein [Tepidanaerobacteraceae bacterium]|nr:helix-turn-helix protein [Tepidanaerobacteraceae bacterium]